MGTIFSHIIIILLTFSCVSPAIKPVSDNTSQTNQAIVSGNQFARDGLLREAVESYKKALAKEPDNQLALRNLGIVFVKAGDFSSAIINLEKSITTYWDNFDANFYLAEAYRATDKFDEAVFRYKSALKIQPNDLRALKSLSWSYYKIRYYQESLSLSQKALQLNPGDEQVPIIVARVLLKLKREPEALAIIRKYKAQVPSSSVPYFQSVEADILYSKGQVPEALTTYKTALKSQPMLAGALLGAGRILLEQGKNAEATDYLERAVRVKPKMYENHYFLGKALEKNSPERAIRHLAHFKKNAATDPEFIEQVQDAKKRISSISSLTSKTKIDDLSE